MKTFLFHFISFLQTTSIQCIPESGWWEDWLKVSLQHIYKENYSNILIWSVVCCCYCRCCCRLFLVNCFYFRPMSYCFSFSFQLITSVAPCFGMSPSYQLFSENGLTSAWPLQIMASAIDLSIYLILARCQSWGWIITNSDFDSLSCLIVMRCQSRECCS